MSRCLFKVFPRIRFPFAFSNKNIPWGLISRINFNVSIPPVVKIRFRIPASVFVNSRTPKQFLPLESLNLTSVLRILRIFPPSQAEDFKVDNSPTRKPVSRARATARSHNERESYSSSIKIGTSSSEQTCDDGSLATRSNVFFDISKSPKNSEIDRVV